MKKDADGVWRKNRHDRMRTKKKIQKELMEAMIRRLAEDMDNNIIKAIDV